MKATVRDTEALASLMVGLYLSLCPVSLSVSLCSSEVLPPTAAAFSEALLVNH